MTQAQRIGYSSQGLIIDSSSALSIACCTTCHICADCCHIWSPAAPLCVSPLWLNENPSIGYHRKTTVWKSSSQFFELFSNFWARRLHIIKFSARSSDQLSACSMPDDVTFCFKCFKWERSVTPGAKSGKQEEQQAPSCISLTQRMTKHMAMLSTSAYYKFCGTDLYGQG